ncbi:maleylpyruvate isomerase family mycothiol-dependent enzyme [Streptomyces sp. FH025]|uniref:maleylpyruvate isomerase family mycothiol-dependent enzyme n=1 Tax=Streptomyces sp. FH025 TaxID=2815937 RepID=UPI001A9EAB85|nr:maleylpyruvate isomerase family mycothiol-dependent enzyme [Streptomyces sp. FH025]MBO1414042.1 maleylpyruvate isomerase family mycothiol-dependent enzyme [Streptomyces sp. FH025]
MESVRQDRGVEWIREQIAAERRELAEVFTGLTEEQWNSPSLCEGWRVREVAAHMSTGFRHSRARTAWELARSGANIHRMADRVARRDAATLTDRELAAAMADHAEHPWRPPVGGRIAALAHDAVHGLDITTALGLPPRLPPARAAALLGAVSARSLRFFGVRLDGVRLRATDVDWSYGEGPLPAEGRAEHLLLVAYGRRLPRGLLAGEGARRFARED